MKQKMEAIIKNLTQKIDELTITIDEFDPVQTWDCKKLQLMCNERSRLIHLLNLAQSDQIAIPNKTIFGVNL